MYAASSRPGDRANRAASHGRRPAVRATSTVVASAQITSISAVTSKKVRLLLTWSPEPSTTPVTAAAADMKAPVRTGYSSALSPGAAYGEALCAKSPRSW